MIERMRAWLGTRTPRERRLLLVMAGLIAVTLIWLAIVLPVTDALADAKARHARALANEAAMTRQIATIRSLRGNAVPLTAPLAAIVQGSASEAGFTAAQVSPVGRDRVDVAIPAARPQALFAWLNALRSRGVFPTSLSMRAAEGQTVAVEMRLRGRGV